MIPLNLRTRTDAEGAERRHALAAAEGRALAVDDPIARVWSWAAAGIGLALVVALLWR